VKASACLKGERPRDGRFGLSRGGAFSGVAFSCAGLSLVSVTLGLERNSISCSSRRSHRRCFRCAGVPGDTLAIGVALSGCIPTGATSRGEAAVGVVPVLMPASIPVLSSLDGGASSGGGVRGRGALLGGYARRGSALDDGCCALAGGCCALLAA
jgi:hypothetical protein